MLHSRSKGQTKGRAVFLRFFSQNALLSLQGVRVHEGVAIRRLPKFRLGEPLSALERNPTEGRSGPSRTRNLFDDPLFNVRPAHIERARGRAPEPHQEGRNPLASGGSSDPGTVNAVPRPTSLGSKTSALIAAFARHPRTAPREGALGHKKERHLTTSFHRGTLGHSFQS